MKFFKLDDEVAKQYETVMVLYKTNDDLTEPQILIIKMNSRQKWSTIEYFAEQLDTTKCIEIDAKEYWNEYDAHIERNSV